MARVLVIGGTAFIGRELVAQLLDRGDEVTLMHRGAASPFGGRVREIRCDRNDIPAVRQALAGASFDLAFDNVYDWQRGTTAAQATAAAEVLGDRLDRYVFTSSVAAYGAGSDHDEQDPLAPSEDPREYVRDKADSERALFALQAARRLSVTTLRPSFVYGPNNPFDREAFFWDRIVRARPVIVPGEGDRVMQWVLAHDVARAALAAAGNPSAEGRAYNLGSHPPVTQAAFVEMLARAAGRPATLVHVPRERILEAGGGQTAPPLYFGAYLDIPPITMRTDRVRSELGVTLTPLEQGLRETFAWYERQQRPQPDFSWEDRLLATVQRS
jgi:nucleoside-diphosphate-sugar epimerase